MTNTHDLALRLLDARIRRRVQGVFTDHRPAHWHVVPAHEIFLTFSAVANEVTADTYDASFTAMADAIVAGRGAQVRPHLQAFTDRARTLVNPLQVEQDCSRLMHAL